MVALVAEVPGGTEGNAEAVAAGIADVGEGAAVAVVAFFVADVGVAAGGATVAGPLVVVWVLAFWLAGPLEFAAGVAVVCSQIPACRFAHCN